MKYSNNDWENLAFGKVDLPTLPSISVLRQLRAIIVYVNAGLTFRNQGSKCIRKFLCLQQSRFRSLKVENGEQIIRIAKRELVTFRVIGRLFQESYICLPASFSLSAGLISLGLPAQLVIGKPKRYLGSDYEFHAWTEICGYAINDTILTQKSFTPVARFPIW